MNNTLKNFLKINDLYLSAITISSLLFTHLWRRQAVAILTSSARLKPADSLDFFGITQAYSLRYSRYFRILPLAVSCDVHYSPRLWPMSGPPDIIS